VNKEDNSFSQSRQIFFDAGAQYGLDVYAAIREHKATYGMKPKPWARNAHMTAGVQLLLKRRTEWVDGWAWQRGNSASMGALCALMWVVIRYDHHRHPTRLKVLWRLFRCGWRARHVASLRGKMHSPFVSAVMAVPRCYNPGRGQNIMKLFRIRITAGAHTGRFVGPNIGGLITDQRLQENPGVTVPNTIYSLYVQEGIANQFLEDAVPKVQAELKKLSYETETIEVS
jgi:hypothetical protein